MNPQLAALIVHDVKNALGALEGELAELSRHPDQTSALQAHANCIGLRDKLIGFLTLYKASEQGLQPRIEAVNPHDFLSELIRSQSKVRAAIEITIADKNMPDVAFFDEHLVGLALAAALQNALRFARARIELDCKTIDHDTVFTIKDDGPGLDGPELGTKEEKHSTGLGMALCKAVAYAHENEARHGEATLNNALEGGALFTLRLP